MAYGVTTADIVNRWRALDTDGTPSEETIASTLLDDAIVKIDLARPMLADAVSAGAVPERLVAMCAAEVVIRVLANPDLNSQQQVGADGSVGVGFHKRDFRPRVVVTDEDLGDIDDALEAADLLVGQVRSVVLTSSSPYYWAPPKDITILPTP
jgi:hypothetical protein